MVVQVKLFAHLRERIGFNQRSVEISSPTTVAGIWQLLTGEDELPNNVLVAVNFSYGRSETPVNDGDEVALFPPVTGG